MYLLIQSYFLLVLIHKQGNSFQLPEILDKSDVESKNNIVDHHKFPYQIFLTRFLDNKYQMECGGTIINDLYIITAGHCVANEEHKVAKPDLFKVFVGLNSKKVIQTRRQIHNVSEVILHPNYDTTVYHNDIAIIKLVKPIEFEYGIEAACINYNDQKYDYLIGSGYGTTSPKFKDLKTGKQIGKQKSGNFLRFALLKENKKLDEDCLDHFICIDSYHKNSGESICMGDSGGPLSTPPQNDGKKQVIGVLSNAIGIELNNELVEFCNGKAKATRLSHHIDFINSIVGKDNYCSLGSIESEV